MSQFKYLNQAAPDSKSSAAQKFLSDKLAKNKYTIDQQETLNANGGPSVAGGPDDATNRILTNQDEIDAYNEKINQPLSGKLSAEQIRDKFGFAYNEQHANNGGGYSKYGGRDDGAIYSKDTGEYIGSIPGFKPSEQSSGKDEAAKGIDKFKAVENYGLEQGFRGAARTNWNTMNDVAGAVNDVFGEGAKDIGDAPEPVYEDVPIEHSPEIQRAKGVVRSYENDALSGATADKIFSTDNDQYSFDAAKGAAGIAMRPSAANNESAEKASNDFLAQKKSNIKDKYKFQAQA